MLLSIITVNLNNYQGLKKTYDSIKSQTFKDYEWIVIDGGSEDESRDFLEKLHDDFIYWVSERDTGIYNAMNKGMKQAHGEFVQFLNSGDWYIDNNVLDNVFRKSDLKDVNYGSIWCVKNDEVIDKRTYPDDMNLSFIMKSPLGHQATFFKTDIVLSHPYKEKFNISADRALFMELYISGFQFKYINIPIVYFDLGGIGSNIKTLAERQKQFHDIKREFFSEQVVCDIEKMIKVEEEFSFVHRVMVLHILYKFFKYIQRIRSKFLYG